jgi:predicted nucleotidyltransferase
MRNQTTSKAFDAASDLIGVILYGSRARGDADAISDTDVCIVTAETPLPLIYQPSDDLLRRLIPEQANLSKYTTTEFQKLVRNGSLFVWHLKLEGRISWSKDGWIESALEDVKPYMRASRDICGYQLLLKDIEESFSSSVVINIFDLAMLFTVARNTCMVLTFLGGQPAFGRTAVFEVARGLYGEQFNFQPEYYLRLASWKLWYARGHITEQDLPGLSEAMLMFDHVQMLTEFALAVIEKYEEPSRCTTS